jgi:hypothetical protein
MLSAEFIVTTISRVPCLNAMVTLIRPLFYFLKILIDGMKKRNFVRSESFLLLEQLRDLVSNAKSLGYHDDDIVKLTFKKILENGDTYSITELEDWFDSKVNSADRSVTDRVLNIAHYQKSKFEANNKFRIVSDGNDCNCNGH